MAILILSLVFSMALGCAVWLVIGNQFPVKQEVKFTPLNNIVIYVLLLVLPVYLLMFNFF
ncbi:MAG: hypothetical protein CMQ21_04870 [Gammaproteobacteria bacterium]|jgi:hypothetical protein|nr:hypothetical protein [Gammaproteobacteria bacterium]|tara:strand:+ start:106 stop:285 length:180 start_codon:yes stop_codon:yes gene_type:complete